MSPSPDRRLRVLLLFGGQSAEHDVSRTSAVAVARALDPARYDVVPVAITREGRWLLAERARAALERPVCWTAQTISLPKRWSYSRKTRGSPIFTRGCRRAVRIGRGFCHAPSSSREI